MAQPRFLITRLSHIGDCVTALPVACALRKAYPKAHIGWVVERPSHQFLESHAAIDVVFTLRRGWLKSPKRVTAIRRELRKHRFDVSIDPQSLTKSSVLGWLSGAKQRIGLAKPWGRELALKFNNDRVTPTQTHVTLRSLELLSPLEVNTSNLEYQFPISSKARSSVHQYLRSHHLGCGYALINPGAGWASRRWPAERFGSVARHLGERGLPSVVAWAGEEEHRWAEDIVARSGGHCQLAPETNLIELAALLEQSNFYLGSDTGPMHLAVAVGTPCITLHGVTRPEDSGALGKQHIPVQAYYQDGASRERRKAENLAMQAIGVDDVVRACEEMLGRQSTRRAA